MDPGIAVKEKCVQIVFTLKAKMVGNDPENTTEAAEEFCLGLKELLVTTGPLHGAEATVEYTVSET